MLTDKGKELIRDGVEERYRRVEPMAETLTAEERTKVNEALAILTRAA